MHTSIPLRKDNIPQGFQPGSSSAGLGLRVVICEDHELTRMGFREICSKIGCQVVGETDNGPGAIELVDHYRPDLLILDML